MADAEDTADVSVEVEDDIASNLVSEEDDLHPSTPGGSLVNDLLQTGVEYLEFYGWYVLIATVIMYVIISRRQSRRSTDTSASSWQRSAADNNRAEVIDRSSAATREKYVEKMLQARLRQQEETDQRVKEFREALQRKQAERDAEQLAEYERLFGDNAGQKLGSATNNSGGNTSSQQGSSGSKPSSSSARLRPDGYMPLGGSATGSTFRPGGGRCRPGARSS